MSLFLLFVVIVLFVCSLNNEVALFCVCVVCFLFVTRLCGFLVCISWSCFFLLFCVQFLFFILLKKDQKNGHSTNPQTNKKNWKRKKSVSAVVFTNSVPNFWGWATKLHFCRKPYKIEGQHILKKGNLLIVKKALDRLLTQKKQELDRFLTLQHIYI